MCARLSKITLSCFLLLIIMTTVPAAFGQLTIVNFDFGAVRILCGGGYAYQFPRDYCGWALSQDFNSTPGFGWTLSQIVNTRSGSGLTGPSSAFAPPPFTGMPFTQAVFLQGRSTFVSQAVGGFTAGNYILSFYLGSRYASGGYDGNQIVVALIDGNVIGTWVVTSYTPFTLVTAPFTVNTDGSHTLKFMGMSQGDHTAFLSYVVITRNQTPEP